MISNTTKDTILQTARIEEVVGDFVSLKRRGASWLGLCPFHNERTPSFTVSPAKGFYKCFGCGKAGDSVNFIMEHEHLTFPEALRYLAAKYNITIEEEAPTAEAIELQSQRETLFAISDFARRFYQDYLWTAEEGKAIGLSYFRERGFTDEVIRRFDLGFAPDSWDAFTSAALAAGHQLEMLEKTGLTVVNENRRYDRFRGRVTFPIHTITGRPIAFGARILRSEANSPKYLNSPETDIYIKSRNLYGISLAKRSIIANDCCYLVEGYTDVISMHQAGVENVVASSGTALTVEQIRLIGRYTRNINVLYDGDPAGIKASLRGIDLILEEGMNVRVVLFPDGEDPDSFSRKLTPAELKDFLSNEAVDFISFKTKLLVSEVADDPIRKAGLIHDIVGTIARIPDAIVRATYLKHTAVLMEMSESVLFAELNRLLRARAQRGSVPSAEVQPDSGTQQQQDSGGADIAGAVAEVQWSEFDTFSQEEEIIRILLLYADHEFTLPGDLNTASNEDNPGIRVKDFVVSELRTDGIHFSNESYAGLLAEFFSLYDEGRSYIENEFLQQIDVKLKSTAISLLTPSHELAQWEMHKVEVRKETDQLHKVVLDPLIYIKKKQLAKIKSELQAELKARQQADLQYDDLLEEISRVNEMQVLLNRLTNTVIQK